MIVKRLSLIDSLRFSAVCPSWRSTCINCRNGVNEQPKFHGSWDMFGLWTWQLQIIVCIVQVKTASTVSPKETADASYSISCIGSVDGFMIIKEYKYIKLVHLDQIMKVIIYLLNPITGARIMLPPLYKNRTVLTAWLWVYVLVTSSPILNVKFESCK